MEFLTHVSNRKGVWNLNHTFNAMADETPLGVVIEGAVYGVHPRVGARNALSRRLSDPLLISE